MTIQLMQQDEQLGARKKFSCRPEQGAYYPAFYAAYVGDTIGDYQRTCVSMIIHLISARIKC
jgi:hypothetical protein